MDACPRSLEELARVALPNAVARHVVQASRANALFAEELMRELLASGPYGARATRRRSPSRSESSTCRRASTPCLAVASTVLPVAEQDTLERASVEGDVFHLGAVEVLTGTATDELARAVMALTERAIVGETIRISRTSAHSASGTC